MNSKLSKLVSTALLPAALWTTKLAAQNPSGTLTTKTDVSNFAVSGTTQDFATTKKNFVLPPIGPFSWRQQAKVSVGSGASGTYASLTSYGYVNNEGVVVLGTSGLVRGSKSSEGVHTTPDASAPGKPGPVEFTLELTSSPGRKGALRVSWQSLLKLDAKASALVDVDDDQQVEWTGGDTGGAFATQIIPVAFDAQGKLVARLAIYAEARGAGQYVSSSNYGRLDIRFQDANAGTCTLTPYGKGCQGASLAGNATTIGAQHVITTKLSGAWPNSFALETIGDTAQSIPLPGGCTLLNNAISILVHPTDAQGEVLVVRKTSTYTRLSTRHQFLPLTLLGKDLALKASNALHLVCTGL